MGKLNTWILLLKQDSVGRNGSPQHPSTRQYGLAVEYDEKVSKGYLGSPPNSDRVRHGGSLMADSGQKYRGTRRPIWTVLEFHRQLRVRIASGDSLAVFLLLFEMKKLLCC